MLGHSVEVGDAEWAPQNIQFDERGWARFQNSEAVHKYMQTVFSDEKSELEKFFYIMHEGEKNMSAIQMNSKSVPPSTLLWRVSP